MNNEAIRVELLDAEAARIGIILARNWAALRAIEVRIAGLRNALVVS